jgi:antitoxin CptB
MIALQRKAKISWHCRRGMLELDLIFGHFLTHQLNQLTEQQLTVFEDLLTYPDPDLYAWLMGYEQPKQKELLDIVTFIRANDKI